MTDRQGAAKAAPRTDLQKIDRQASWIAARLREPSTYSGLATILSAAVLFHVIPDAAVTPLIKSLTMIGMGIGGLLGVILPEQR